MSQCQFSPLCPRHAQPNGFCIGHRVFATGEARKKETVTVVKPIKKVSEKQAKQNNELHKLEKIFLSKPENQYCAIHIDDNCTKEATTVNHKKRRGKNEVLNMKTWEPSCSYCNVAIESNDAWAREHNHLESKFKK